MKKIEECFVIFFCIIAAATNAQQLHSVAGHTMFVPNEIKWVNAPPSFPSGAMIAVLDGDMSKPGIFTVRAKLPAHYKIMPHWHMAAEHVTVVKGTFYMGMGDSFDRHNAMKIPEGGFAVMEINTRHYGFTGAEECIIQIHGIGPWSITYVNPADDPRKSNSH